LPPRSRGPSSNTWPRWPPHAAQVTSVRFMKRLRSVCSSMLALAAGSVKLGQPVPDSNFASDEKSATPQPAQRYMPSSFVCAYPPVNGGSVPLRRSTSYCAGVSSSRHCLSVLSIFVLISLRIRFHYVGPERGGNGSPETGQAEAGAEQPAQGHPTAVQAALERGLAEVEHRRRLARGQAFHVAQHDGRTEVDRELAQRGGERGAQLLALDLLVGPRGVGREVVERAFLSGDDRARRRPLRERPLRLVVGDPVEPREEARASLETGQAAPCAEERLLGHVTRLVVVEAEAAK